jgi:hypothetical protein
MDSGQRLNVVDTSDLTDADWPVINQVNSAYEAGGIDAFWDELEKLDDVIQQVTVASAFFPDLIRELLLEYMQAHGLTLNDLRELVWKAESL